MQTAWSHHQTGTSGFSISSALTLSVDLFIIYCLGQHKETWGGGGRGSRATAWHMPMHGPSSGCGRGWWGWVYSRKSQLTDTWMMMCMYSDYCNWGNSPGKGHWAIYCTVGLQLQDTWVCSASLTVEYLLRNRPLPVGREAKQTFATRKSGDVANG